jgi:hypothetical protein
MTNTDPSKKSGVELGLEKDQQILLLIEIYSDLSFYPVLTWTTLFS